MSTENEEFDISNSMAAELTGSLGMSDDGDNASDTVLDAVAEQEQYLAERGVPVSNEVDDTRQGDADREAEQASARKQKVPLAALHEERTKRQAAEAQLQEQAQLLQQLRAQQQALQQAQLQQQQEAAIPDFDEDPRGHVEAVKQQFKQELENLKNGTAQQPQVQQLEARVMQEAAALAPALAQAEAQFTEQYSDYPQAFDHLSSVLDANVRAQHPGINEQQLNMLRTAALTQFVQRCQAQGISPAAYAYQRAQAMGYRAPRRSAPTSLANAYGSARAPDEKSGYSAEDISSMSEAEFDKLWSNMKRGAAIGPAF